MQSRRVAIVDVGSGNLFSLLSAFRAVGASPRLVDRPEALHEDDHIVLPGQGKFSTFMHQVDAHGWHAPLVDLITSGRHVLGICLGMQILFDESDEGREVAGAPIPGLGLIKGRIERFAFPPVSRLKVPHMGWNAVSPHPDGHGVMHKELYGSQFSHFYFVHSYRAVVDAATGEAHVDLWADYGGLFPAAVSIHNTIAVQFHPEKSQQGGLHLLKHFVERS